MICEICGRQENLNDTMEQEILIVGVCGNCHAAIACHFCIDQHLEVCIPYQMIVKESHILQ